MVTQSHKNRTRKDQLATFLTSSMLPQHADNNSDFFESAWYNFEKYASNQLVRIENNSDLAPFSINPRRGASKDNFKAKFRNNIGIKIDLP
jgi:hypothetical protein